MRKSAPRQRAMSGLVSMAMVATAITVAGAAPSGVAQAASCTAGDFFVNSGGEALTRYDSSGTEIYSVELPTNFYETAWSTDGTTLYGVQRDSNTLDTLDPVTGAVLASTPITGAATTGPWSALSAEPGGTLLLGARQLNNTGSRDIFRVDPADGTSTVAYSITNESDLRIRPTGDFITLDGGVLLLVGEIRSGAGAPLTNFSYLIGFAGGAQSALGQVPKSFGAARVGDDVYLAGADGQIHVLAAADIPTTPQAAGTPVPTTPLFDTGLSIFGAASVQDGDSCNDGLPAGVTDPATTDQLNAVDIDVLANDLPLANIDATSVKLIDPNAPTAPGVTTLTVPDTGEYVVNPTTGEVTFTPEITFTGESSVFYEFIDNTGKRSGAAIDVTVAAVPFTANDDTETTEQGVPVVIPVLDNDSPPELADPTTVEVTWTDGGGATQVGTDLDVPDVGNFLVDPTTGEVTFTPVPTFFGATNNVGYIVTDLNGNPEGAGITVTVNEDTTPPTANDDTATVAVDENATIQVLDNDVADGAPIDDTTVTLIDGATRDTTIVITGEGTYTVAGGIVTFDPDPIFVGASTIQYDVADTNGNVSAPATITVTVTDTVPPTANADTASTPYDTNATIDVLGNDTDGDLAIDPATVAVNPTTIAGKGAFTVNPTTGVVTFNPDPAFIAGGPVATDYTVDDTAGNPSNSATITVTVGAAAPPNAVNDTATTNEGVTVTKNVLANDSAGSGGFDDVTVVGTATPAGSGTYTALANNQIRYAPAAGFSGSSSINYEVTNGAGLTDTAKLTVTVTAAPEPPSDLEAIEPARFLETRTGATNKTFDGQFQKLGRVGARKNRIVTIGGRGDIPTDATAVFANIVIIGASGPGFATGYDCAGTSSTPPQAATVNYTGGDVAANAVLVPLRNGRLCVYTTAAADMVIDISGYVPAGATPETISPKRFLETRTGATNKTFDGQFQKLGRVGARKNRIVTIGGRGGIPTDATAVFANIVIIGASGPGFATGYDCAGTSSTPPQAATVNYTGGDVAANAVLVPLRNGRLCVYTTAAADMVIDISGYVPG